MNNQYDQFIKHADRHLCIKRAVELLTQFREDCCCVPRNYVRNIYDHFTLTEDDSRNKEEASKIKIGDIINWEKLHDSCMGTKKASELCVCYLSGPQPTNDFHEFIELGVLPQNIWALEMEDNIYKTAVEEVSSSQAPMPRIINQKLENFMRETPKKFDIIYVDACGSIPSKSHALRCITSICENQRINSPGIIISNFAEPDQNEFEDYLSLISPYLYFKQNAEQYDELKQFHNLNCFSNGACTHNDFQKLYGDFISATLRDLPSVLIPLRRMKQSSYFSPVFDMNRKKIDEIPLEQIFQYSKGSSLARFVFYCKSKDQLSRRIKEFFNETVDLSTLYEAFALETLIRKEYIEFPKKLHVSEFISGDDNLYQFLDRPHENLFMDVIINQLVYPMHYVASLNARYMYKARTKWMYSDITVYDECRYIYEWLPTVSMMRSIKEEPSVQYIFRFAADGLIKQRENYNNEFLYQGAVISGMNNDEFSAKKICDRINLNERR